MIGGVSSFTGGLRCFVKCLFAPAGLRIVATGGAQPVSGAAEPVVKAMGRDPVPEGQQRFLVEDDFHGPGRGQPSLDIYHGFRVGRRGPPLRFTRGYSPVAPPGRNASISISSLIFKGIARAEGTPSRVPRFGILGAVADRFYSPRRRHLTSGGVSRARVACDAGEEPRQTNGWDGFGRRLFTTPKDPVDGVPQKVLQEHVPRR